MNNSNEFWSMARTSDYTFSQLMSKFCSKQRVLVPRERHENYLDHCERIDDRVVVSHESVTSFIRSTQSRFVHAYFRMGVLINCVKSIKQPFFNAILDL